MDLVNASELSENSILWSFLSIEKFLSFIINTNFHFTRLDQFEDALEGINRELLLFEHTNKSLEQLPPFKGIELIAFDFFPEQSDELNNSFKKQQKTKFSNCWYVSDRQVESLAMWKLYSNSNSVAINIPYSDLFNLLEQRNYGSVIGLKSLKIGLVKYVNFQNPNEISDARKNWEVGFTKDMSFSHEKEFRIVAEIEENEAKTFEQKPGISLKSQLQYHEETSELWDIQLSLEDFKNLPFEIVFHPQIDDWVKKDLQSVLKTYEIPFAVRDSNIQLQ